MTSRTRISRAAQNGKMPEIAKVKDWHSYPFPFVGGQIDVASFPGLAWSRALREALKPPHLHFSLRDGIDEDDAANVGGVFQCPLLREQPAVGVSGQNVRGRGAGGVERGLDVGDVSRARSRRRCWSAR